MLGSRLYTDWSDADTSVFGSWGVRVCIRIICGLVVSGEEDFSVVAEWYAIIVPR